MGRGSTVIATVVWGAILSSCGSGETADSVAPTTAAAPFTAETGSATPPTPATTSTQAPTLTLPPVVHDQADLSWTAAKAKGHLDVFEAPGSAAPFRVLDPVTILGTPTVVLVLGGGDAWLEVMVPGRPNGQTGWVRGMDVERFQVERQVVVDLGDRRLRVLEGTETIFETEIGVGSPASPTPTGSFFVTDAVRITNPTGPWGPYAFGLSARSDTVTEFNGGDGIIGIHGTNRPTSIGGAQSLGCVRVPNEVMLEVAALVSVGSPVTIEA